MSIVACIHYVEINQFVNKKGFLNELRANGY